MWPESNRAHFMAVMRRNTLFAGALKTATKIIRQISVHHRDSLQRSQGHCVYFITVLNHLLNLKMNRMLFYEIIDCIKFQTS